MQPFFIKVYQEKAKRGKHMSKTSTFEKRLGRHHDELRWLYMELYNNSSMFAELCDNMERFFKERNQELKSMELSERHASAYTRKQSPQAEY